MDMKREHIICDKVIRKYSLYREEWKTIKHMIKSAQKVWKNEEEWLCYH